MQIETVDFSKLDCTLETFGDNLILKLAIKPDSPVSRDYLTRAVVTLLNYGAIDFIPEPGVMEYDNLRPYTAGRDDYAMLQTSRKRLRHALETLGYVNMVWAQELLCIKRDKAKPKAKRKLSPFWDEVKKNGLDKNRAAFKQVSSNYWTPSEVISYNVSDI